MYLLVISKESIVTVLELPNVCESLYQFMYFLALWNLRFPCESVFEEVWEGESNLSRSLSIITLNETKFSVIECI